MCINTNNLHIFLQASSSCIFVIFHYSRFHANCFGQDFLLVQTSRTSMVLHSYRHLCRDWYIPLYRQTFPELPSPSFTSQIMFSAFSEYNFSLSRYISVNRLPTEFISITEIPSFMTCDLYFGFPYTKEVLPVEVHHAGE